MSTSAKAKFQRLLLITAEAAAEGIAAYLAGENAGQCRPYRNGLPTLAAHSPAPHR